jgi:hypothetical protein
VTSTTEWPPPWIGLATLVGVAIIYDVLLYFVRRADRAFPSTNPTESTWWFGYARDLANFAGMFGFAIGFRLLGIPGARALLLGVGLGLLGYGLDYYIARKLAARYAKVFLAVALILLIIPIASAREELDAGLQLVLGALF